MRQEIARNAPRAMKITSQTAMIAGPLGGVEIILEQNGLHAMIGSADLSPGEEGDPRRALARALREAADWLDAGPVDLSPTRAKGRASRTPM